MSHNAGLVALGGVNYHLIDAKSIIFNAFFEILCIIGTSAVLLVMTFGNYGRYISLPHQRTNCDGRSFQRRSLLHKLLYRDLIVKEPLDAGKAKPKEANAEQGDKECQLQISQNHGRPQCSLYWVSTVQAARVAITYKQRQCLLRVVPSHGSFNPKKKSQKTCLFQGWLLYFSLSAVTSEIEFWPTFEI